MSIRVDPSVTQQLNRFGGESAVKCFNCGNCTAVCQLTKQDAVFPRRYIRYIQLGLEEKMRGSIDPWLCYYCGDCSKTCPRPAEPGKLMMASRRWLIAAYDWTGVSSLLYRRPAWQLAILALVALAVLALFTVPEQFGFRLLAAHPEARENVNLAFFAPKELVHAGDMALAALLAALLLSNAARMVYWVRRRGARARWWDYAWELGGFLAQGLTQMRWRGCATPANKQWLRHLALVSGYLTMGVMVEAFLQVFQVEDSSVHWTSYLGYYATVVLLGASGWMIIDRIRNRELASQNSDLTDWSFLILLFLAALSGIVLHIVRVLNLPMATYVMYTAHMMIAVSMLVVMVPFGKWSHLLYRPLALYLLAVERRAQARQAALASPAPSLVAA